MESRMIRIGTRGSTLARVQTDMVVAAIARIAPNVTTEVTVITTKGDVNQAPIPLDTVGKAWFTAEIEEGLLDGSIDLAVHSLKDLPPELPERLVAEPVLAREDARDVLISKSGKALVELPAGAIIGTDSLRRKALVLHARPDLVVTSVRGNVETRIRKLHEGDYDALILAAAGLIRLGKQEEITEYFPIETIVPAIGQGILAIEYRAEDSELATLVHSLQNAATSRAYGAERAFSEVVGGGCKLPVGCYAEVSGDRVAITGMVGSMDGAAIAIDTVEGSTEDAIRLGEELARALKKKVPN